MGVEPTAFTFQGIKAGDQIIVAGRALVVERVTATHLVAGDLRVVRASGKIVGRSRYAEIATPERLARAAEYAAATVARADLMIIADRIHRRTPAMHPRMSPREIDALLRLAGPAAQFLSALADAGVE